MTPPTLTPETPTRRGIGAILAALFEAREMYAARSAACQDAERALRASPLFVERDRIAAAVRELEESARAAALARYEATGETHPGYGTSVVQKVNIEPGPNALAWARETGLCLALDSKAFAKLAKATGLPPEVAVVSVEPAVRIPDKTLVDEVAVWNEEEERILRAAESAESAGEGFRDDA